MLRANKPDTHTLFGAMQKLSLRKPKPVAKAPEFRWRRPSVHSLYRIGPLVPSNVSTTCAQRKALPWQSPRTRSSVYPEIIRDVVRCQRLRCGASATRLARRVRRHGRGKRASSLRRDDGFLGVWLPLEYFRVSRSTEKLGRRR